MPAALADQFQERVFHPLKVCDLRFDVGHLLSGLLSHIRTSGRGVEPQVQQGLDLFEREPQFFRPPNEPQDGDRFFVASYGGPHYAFDLTFDAGNATTFLDTRLPTSFPAGLRQGPLDPDDDAFDEMDLVPFAEFGFYDFERQSGFNALVLSITPRAGAVPEPSTWTMLILGFGAVGGTLRRTRRSVSSFVASA